MNQDLLQFASEFLEIMHRRLEEASKHPSGLGHPYAGLVFYALDEAFRNHGIDLGALEPCVKVKDAIPRCYHYWLYGLSPDTESFFRKCSRCGAEERSW